LYLFSKGQGLAVFEKPQNNSPGGESVSNRIYYLRNVHAKKLSRVGTYPYRDQKKYFDEKPEVKNIM